jgi:PadR family transcriptional regulator, regulatory protein PadR
MKRFAENAEDIPGSQEFECKRFVNSIIKSNREVFIMFCLLEKQMCGYDIIKEVLSTCDIFLSQGTVYPILYTMEGEGLLHAEYSKGDMRSKKYSLTPKGREIAENELKNFGKALEQVSMLLKR